MNMVRLISFTSRVFLMITLVLGLLYWIAQLPFLSGLLTMLVQINLTSIHKGFGFLGVFGLLILGIVAVFTRGSRLPGAAGIFYALLVPAFGLTQAVILVGPLHWVIQAAHLLVGIGAMYLALGIEKRYQQRKLKLKEQGATSARPQGLVGRLAVLTNTTTKEQGVTSAQPQGRPYPPLVTRLARAAVAAHVALYRLSGGKLGGHAQHMPVLLLTTTGRKSGKPHTTALVYMPDGDDFVVVASNGGQARLPNWWLNLRKSKQAQIEVGRKRLRVSVQEASGEERERLWSRIIAYRAGHEAYQELTPYPLPVVSLHPEEALS
jgi:deazaflavin-dependent oxidoreductase (nitroreductase family)